MSKRKIIALIAAFVTSTTACSSQNAVTEPWKTESADLTSTLVTNEPQKTQFAETAAATSAIADANAETTTEDYSQIFELKYAPPIAENPKEHVMAQYEKFDYEQYVSDDKEAEAIAIAVYKDSNYYKEALADAKEMLKYENGELVRLTENWKTYFGGFEAFVTETDTHGIELEPKIAVNIKAKLDGEKEENLFVITAALPTSCCFTSGEAACIAFGIYVNSEGQAFILNDSIYQGHLSFSATKYTRSGKIHAIFNSCHSAGTARTAIYSFQNGEPKLEMYGYGNMNQCSENGKIWVWGQSDTYYIEVFYDGDEEKYYQIKSEES